MSYKELKTYQNTVIIYDFTTEFTQKYIDYRSRTRDQMDQAARSGKQNIVEGTEGSKTSSKTELKLLGVARMSLEELLEDYVDFLRQKGLKLWDRDSAEAKEVRNLVYRTDRTYRTYKSYLSEPEKAANAIICLINQTNYLLDRQIKSAEEKFIKGGGYTENLFRKRLAQRKL